jgi:hypothetical protein
VGPGIFLSRTLFKLGRFDHHQRTDTPDLSVGRFYLCANRACEHEGARGLTMLNDDGVRRLAIAVLQQAISDLTCASETDRHSAKAFVDREDFDSWCALAGVNPLQHANGYRNVRARLPSPSSPFDNWIHFGRREISAFKSFDTLFRRE